MGKIGVLTTSGSETKKPEWYELIKATKAEICTDVANKHLDVIEEIQDIRRDLCITSSNVRDLRHHVNEGEAYIHNLKSPNIDRVVEKINEIIEYISIPDFDRYSVPKPQPLVL